ncbi:hypothetical protein EUTSA_v10022506mg [Eutrema salsugineum]|uniref:Uncharacterized protein n=1 Tax=Eutrema salsugineum TaxID=72664 RepID=V4LGB4_EUTSA|nr:hypothetical protein EUTSA_v10022506mg [Eutrema salsugineum]
MKGENAHNSLEFFHSEQAKVEETKKKKSVKRKITDPTNRKYKQTKNIYFNF